MNLPVEVLLGADLELQQIYEQLENYREGFGLEFLTLVEAYLTRISAFPEIAPIYLGPIRRQLMYTLPYGIFYEPMPTRIVVLAVLNLRQDERAIFRRLSP